MRSVLIVMWLLLGSITSADAQVSVAIGLPNVSIGSNLPTYPNLVPVPGYPVYYAPQVDSNYFFYDGMYWIYHRDNWYTSSWYNGPWGLVGPEAVPVFVLRVPVRYYRRPPTYFRGWSSDAPPRWGEHWGRGWEQNRRGWDEWNRASVPSPAPLPVYQRQYSGAGYPRADQQQVIQTQNYRYQPRDTIAQQRYQSQGLGNAPESSPSARASAPPNRIVSSPPARPSAPAEGVGTSRDERGPGRSTSAPQGASGSAMARAQPPQNSTAVVQKPVPLQASAAQERVSTSHDPRGSSRASYPQAGTGASHEPLPGQGDGQLRKPAVAQISPQHTAVATPHQAQQPQQPAAQRQQAPKPQGAEKSREEGEQRGSEHNK